MSDNHNRLEYPRSLAQSLTPFVRRQVGELFLKSFVCSSAGLHGIRRSEAELAISGRVVGLGEWCMHGWSGVDNDRVYGKHAYSLCCYVQRDRYRLFHLPRSLFELTHTHPKHLIKMSLSSKLTITDVSLKGEKVLIRVDFNVPQDKKTNEITNPAVSGKAYVVDELPSHANLCVHGLFTAYRRRFAYHQVCHRAR